MEHDDHTPAVLDDEVACMPQDGDAETDVEVLKDVPRGFAIDCEEHANWLVKKVVAARSYAARVKQWAEREQRRAAREEHTLMFLFGRQIENWTRSEIDRLHGRRKSLNLPAGTVGLRTISPSLQVDDEQRVVAWAMIHCSSAVVTEQRLIHSTIKEHFERTGEMPEAGVHVRTSEDRFYIR